MPVELTLFLLIFAMTTLILTVTPWWLAEHSDYCLKNSITAAADIANTGTI